MVPNVATLAASKGKCRSMRDYYFDDLKLGDTFTSPSFTLTDQEMIAFAEKYDPQPFHLNAEAAAATHFGGLVAGGFQTAALTWGLALKTGVFQKMALAGLGIDGLRWLKPVRVGDTLTCRFEVLETRRSSSKPGQGIAVSRFDLINQHDDLVFTMRMAQLLKCREAQAKLSP
jgi:acyl dehydratase